MLKRLIELQLSMSQNGCEIEDIQVVSDKEYGYIVVLTKLHKGIYDEVLKMKLEDMNGKRILPDLWLFGPYTTKK
ncbi:MAG: hypothetical protein QXQ40_01780 [Candidatus Aenigmatarchaeota archaeon]